MNFPQPFVRPPISSDPPAHVRLISREDVMWNRPVFKAPPLVVRPPLAEVAAMVADVRRHLTAA